MNYETATKQQLMNIISYDKDLPTHLLGGVVEEMIIRGMWDGIIKYSAKKVYRNVPFVLNHILQMEIEDLIQIGNIEIARIVSTFKHGKKSFKDYAIMCLRGKFNVIRQYAETEKRSSDRNTSDIDDFTFLLQSSVNVESYVINKIMIEEVWGTLREVEKQMIILELQGYGREELSEMLGYSKNSGRSLLPRAYKKLRKAMSA
jgi:RNA polymerase sigma factor (sigma-70 family)